jgi:LL-diaminopimelate aminotransferase
MARFEPYFFSELALRMQALRAEGRDIIRLDMGSPDLPPPDQVIEALIAAARDPAAHGYQPYGGPMPFRQCVARYYLERYGVSLDPAGEVVGLIGSKEGVFHLSQALLNMGDIALVPDPGYPTYARGALAAGAEVFRLPLLEENGYLPDLEAIPGPVLKRAKLLWLNYPNNPTSALATGQYFRSVVAFARQNSLVVAHDAPYLEIGYDGYQAPSFLESPGAGEVGLEFNSLSKSFNMAGWRMGMAVGNPRLIDLLHTYKVQVDSAHFGPVYSAGCAALSGDRAWIAGRNEIYQQRRDVLFAGLPKLGFRPKQTLASLYVWARLPEGVDGAAFCDRLLVGAGVSVTPGEVFGAAGRGYLRFALCTPEKRIREALDRMAEFMELMVPNGR